MIFQMVQMITAYLSETNKVKKENAIEYNKTGQYTNI